MNYKSQEEYDQAMSDNAQAEADNEAELEHQRAMDEWNVEINRLTDYLYAMYGSGTGVLFGIPSDLRPSVRAIVKIVLEREKRNKEV